MISQKNYTSLFQKVYLLLELLFLLLWVAYQTLSFLDANKPEPGIGFDFFFMEDSRLPFVAFCLLFVFPALGTWVVTGIVRLTSKLEPRTEQEQALSLAERKSKLQLFVLISAVLLVPFFICRILNIHIQVASLPRWMTYAAVLVHAGFSLLLVLFLRRLSACRKTSWKILASMLFVFALITYPIALYAGYRLADESEIEYADDFYEECEESEDPNIDFVEADPETLANVQVINALGLFSDSDSFISTAANFLPFDPEYFDSYVNMISAPEGTSDQELERLSEQKRLQDSTTHQLSRFYNWLFVQSDSETFEPMVAYLKTALLQHESSINYKDYALRVDMLDMAYRELDASNEEENNFYRIYEYASEHPFKWTLYCENFITDPYIRYTVDGDTDAQQLMLWAYTFWGRRYNEEGSLWNWRHALNQLLDVHPNTHYPSDEIDKQRKLMRHAEQRAVDFLKWYKANYWSFQELRVAEYDQNGKLAKFDSEQADKYLYAIEKSGHLSPKLIQQVRNRFTAAQNREGVKSGRLKNCSEWLRTDPLIPGYNALAGEIEDAQCRTDFIRQAGLNMQLSLTAGLVIDMECVNGEWLIYQFSVAKAE